jgi:hypothetical protein
LTFKPWLLVAAPLLAALAALAAPAITPPETERDAIVRVDRSAHDARVRKDYAAYKQLVLELDRLMPGNPEVLVRMALADAGLGHPETALADLVRFAAMGQADPGFAKQDGLASVRQLSAYPGLERQLEANAQPISHAALERTLGQADLISEDLAYDPRTKIFFVSSVRHRKIVALRPDHTETDFVSEGRDGIWSVLALAVDDARRLLWATTAAMPQSVPPPSAKEAGRSALLAYDLASGALRARYDLPPGAHAVLGDMTIGPHGDIYVSEAEQGVVYILRSGHRALEVLVPAGTFVSPQNPAATPDGLRLFVADYTRGVGVIELTTGRVSWLPLPEKLTLAGTDGMYLAGQTLFAVQNGTNPNRVLRVHLNPALDRVLSWEAVESGSPQLGSPTHGVVVGSSFDFLGKSGWEHVGEDGALRKGEHFDAPVILSVPLG